MKKWQPLAWGLSAGLVTLLLCAAAVPIQVNYFTSTNYKGTTAATALAYLGLGSANTATVSNVSAQIATIGVLTVTNTATVSNVSAQIATIGVLTVTNTLTASSSVTSPLYQSAAAAGANAAGTDSVFEAGASTGTAEGGRLLGKSSLNLNASGSSVNSQAPVYDLHRHQITLANNTTAKFANISCANGTSFGGVVNVFAYAWNGSSNTIFCEYAPFVAFNTNSTVVTVLTAGTQAKSDNGGPSTSLTLSVVANGQGVDFKANVNSTAYTPTSIILQWSFTSLFGTDTGMTITDQ